MRNPCRVLVWYGHVLRETRKHDADGRRSNASLATTKNMKKYRRAAATIKPEPVKRERVGRRVHFRRSFRTRRVCSSSTRYNITVHRYDDFRLQPDESVRIRVTASVFAVAHGRYAHVTCIITMMIIIIIM